MHMHHVETATRQVALQHTLKAAIGCTGIGLHGGKRIGMTLKPAAAGTGIVFRRTDVESDGSGRAAVVPARWDTVVDTRMCTVIGNKDGVTVATIEHLMAALAGCGVDNAEIEIDGAEVPAMDGSAAPFVFLIECAGLAVQDAPRMAIKVLKTVSVTEGDKTVCLSPSDAGFSISFSIDFTSAAIRNQTYGGRIDLDGAFKTDIARARTFGFLAEVTALRAAGLAKGGSLDNAVVIDENDRVMNEDGLRFDDEFVRHKALDALGDLYIAGHPIQGAFDGRRSGHDLNNKLLRALFADDGAWALVPARPTDEATGIDTPAAAGGARWAGRAVAARA